MIIVIGEKGSDITAVKWEDYLEFRLDAPKSDAFIIKLDEELQNYAGGIVYRENVRNVYSEQIKEIGIGVPEEITGRVYIMGLNEKNQPRGLDENEFKIIVDKMNKAINKEVESLGQGILLITEDNDLIPLDPLEDKDIETLLRKYLGHRTQFRFGVPDPLGYCYCVNINIESSSRTNKLNSFASKLSGQSIYGDIIVTKSLNKQTHTILNSEDMGKIVRLNHEGK